MLVVFISCFVLVGEDKFSVGMCVNWSTVGQQLPRGVGNPGHEACRKIELTCGTGKSRPPIRSLP